MRLNNLDFIPNTDSLNIEDVSVCEDKPNADVITEEYSQLEVPAHGKSFLKKH